MPPDPVAGAALRWGRAVVLAAVTLGFAATAHVAADGSLPGPVGLGVLAVATTAVLACLLGRPASTRRLVLLVTLGQAVLHAALSTGGHAGAAAVSTVPRRVAVPEGRLADALGADQLPAYAEPGPLASWVTHLVADLAAPGALAMTGAHAIAAVLVGLWLAAGERLVWRLVALLTGPAQAAAAAVRLALRADLAAVLAVLSPPARPTVLGTGPPLPGFSAFLPARAVARRGPPQHSG